MMKQAKSLAKEYHKGSALIRTDESIVFVYRIMDYDVIGNGNFDINKYLTNKLNIESEINIKDVNIYSNDISVKSIYLCLCIQYIVYALAYPIYI